MRPEDERLSGLLDGELRPEEAAEVAEALANHPALASRFAAMARMRASVAALDRGLPTPPLAPQRRSSPYRLAGAVAGAAALVLLAFLVRPVEAPSVAAVHRHFAGGETAGLNAERSGPDLAPAGLQPAVLRHVAGGIYTGYVGPRGCRVAVWIGPAKAALPEALAGWQTTTAPRGDGQVIWIAADAAMPWQRFMTVAALARGEAARPNLTAEAGPAPPCRA
ncbi:hypothetical protein [Roseomonas populi]|uniref:Anti-sigma factor n=1 Tax=Roseomonas populi TaxID=3121582 RepID=A0ABT1X527_9PROT|nr:hypothetical protein [Roseomonas pecuniae]MCR0982824.1 hypothetical protein [Roseomonas pecuniae]